MVQLVEADEVEGVGEGKDGDDHHDEKPLDVCQHPLQDSDERGDCIY